MESVFPACSFNFNVPPAGHNAFGVKFSSHSTQGSPAAPDYPGLNDMIPLGSKPRR